MGSPETVPVTTGKEDAIFAELAQQLPEDLRAYMPTAEMMRKYAPYPKGDFEMVDGCPYPIDPTRIPAMNETPQAMAGFVEDIYEPRDIDTREHAYKPQDHISLEAIEKGAQIAQLIFGIQLGKETLEGVLRFVEGKETVKDLFTVSKDDLTDVAKIVGVEAAELAAIGALLLLVSVNSDKKIMQKAYATFAIDHGVRPEDLARFIVFSSGIIDSYNKNKVNEALLYLDAIAQTKEKGYVVSEKAVAALRYAHGNLPPKNANEELAFIEMYARSTLSVRAIAEKLGHLFPGVKYIEGLFKTVEQARNIAERVHTARASQQA